MNETNMPPSGEPSPEEIMSALFANMVIQNTNMALMFLGKVPHPQTGQPIKDLDSAQMFLDQLEMLAYKTRNNLSREEEQLLKQSLTELRLVFVAELRREGIPVPDHLSLEPEAAPKTEAAPQALQAAAPAPAPQQAPAATPPPAPASAPAPEPEESRKRFTKKY
jgi:hypothetical protein